VTIYDTGIDGTTAFLVMEVLSGPTLAERAARADELALPEILNIGEQVCQALSAAHATGVDRSQAMRRQVSMTLGSPLPAPTVVRAAAASSRLILDIADDDCSQATTTSDQAESCSEPAQGPQAAAAARERDDLDE
jgi:hypothetical protein